MLLWSLLDSQLYRIQPKRLRDRGQDCLGLRYGGRRGKYFNLGTHEKGRLQETHQVTQGP